MVILKLDVNILIRAYQVLKMPPQIYCEAAKEDPPRYVCRHSRSCNLNNTTLQRNLMCLTRHMNWNWYLYLKLASEYLEVLVTIFRCVYLYLSFRFIEDLYLYLKMILSTWPLPFQHDVIDI